MLIRVVAVKACDRRNQLDAVIWLRVGPKEIVLRKVSYQTISSKEQSERLDNSGFSSVVATNQHNVFAEA